MAPYKRAYLRHYDEVLKWFTERAANATAKELSAALAKVEEDISRLRQSKAIMLKEGHTPAYAVQAVDEDLAKARQLSLEIRVLASNWGEGEHPDGQYKRRARSELNMQTINPKTPEVAAIRAALLGDKK